MHEAVVGLMHTTDVLRRQAAAVMAAHGLTLQQFNVLRILRGAGDEGLPTLAIAARMVEETPGITRLLDRLEAKGLVRRDGCPKDRRRHLCWITPTGLEALAALDAPVVRAHAHALKGLSKDDTRTLIRLLDQIRAAHHAEE
jgi:DNA-binding MarR family transcriptional regulator